MFKTEDCLVKSYIPHCETLTSTGSKRLKEKTIVLREVSVGFGIADIVVVEHIPCSHFEQTLTKHDVSIYKAIEKQNQVSVEAIIETTRLNRQQVNNSLDKLGILGYVTWNDPTIVVLARKYESTIRNVIAIEAKLKDWKRALNQAYRYKWFASRSYVLLDTAHLNPAIKNLAVFQEMGVGLMALDFAGNWQTLYEPTAVEPIDIRMVILLNEQVKEHFYKSFTMKPERASTTPSGSCYSLQ